MKGTSAGDPSVLSCPAKLPDGPEVGVQRVFPVDVVGEGHEDYHSSECSPF